jgi:hypothetical protein
MFQMMRVLGQNAANLLGAPFAMLMVMLKQTLPVLALLTLCGACVSPTRNVARSLEASDRVFSDDPAAICGVDAPSADGNGFGLQPLFEGKADGVIFTSSENTLEVELRSNQALQVFTWPTTTGTSLFYEGEEVRLQRTSELDPETGITVTIDEIVGTQAHAVILSARRFVPGAGDDKLVLDTPGGTMHFGPLECERTFSNGCGTEREQHFAGLLKDGTVIAPGSPLSRGDVILDWAHGSRAGLSRCGFDPGSVDETLEIAYFGPALPGDL